MRPKPILKRLDTFIRPFDNFEGFILQETCLYRPGFHQFSLKSTIKCSWTHLRLCKDTKGLQNKSWSLKSILRTKFLNFPPSWTSPFKSIVRLNPKNSTSIFLRSHPFLLIVKFIIHTSISQTTKKSL